MLRCTTIPHYSLLKHGQKNRAHGGPTWAQNKVEKIIRVMMCRRHPRMQAQSLSSNSGTGQFSSVLSPRESGCIGCTANRCSTNISWKRRQTENINCLFHPSRLIIPSSWKLQRKWQESVRLALIEPLAPTNVVPDRYSHVWIEVLHCWVAQSGGRMFSPKAVWTHHQSSPVIVKKTNLGTNWQ